ncbi:MAG: NADP-dependent oxidoreductase [Alkalibacterium sp.]|nr:NADP-dependent oxidoreductase [Alkalibacterium sp.]
MRAIVIEEFGGVEQLTLKEVDKPVLKPNRMLVEQYATSVNPIDVKRRKGSFGGKLPMIVGGDVAGVVTEVGDDVTDFQIGDRVMANGAKTYAEIVSVNPDRAVKLADTVAFEHAAALPLAGQTAYEAIVTRAKVESGDRVLVHGGSGGVGSIAVQIAKLKGAWVASTASGENQELLESLGADRPINYKEEKFEDSLSDLDVVFDTIGGDVQKNSFRVLKEKGRLVSIAEEPDKDLQIKQVDASYFSFSPKKESLEELNRWLTDSQLQPVISHEYSFTEEEVREAHKVSETGHAGGKLIITFK